MPKYFKEQIVKDIFPELREISDAIHKSYSDYGLDKIPFDHREFVGYMMVFHPEITAENANEIVIKEIDSFKGKTEKEIYNKVMEYVDSFDYAKLDLNTPEGTKAFFANYKCSQLFGKMPEFYKAAHKERYSSLEKQRLYDNNLAKFIYYNTEMGSEFEHLCGHKIGNLEYRELDEDDYAYEETTEYERYNKKVLEDILPAMTKYTEGVTSAVEVEMPYGELKALKLEVNENRLYKNIPDPFLTDFFDTVMQGPMPPDTWSYKLADEFHGKSCVYIDGKNIFDFVDPNASLRDKKSIASRVFLEAVAAGKAIDVAKSYIVDGEFKTEIVPLQFKASKQQMADVVKDYKKSHHSWFRRAFFDWGPFKIDISNVKDPFTIHSEMNNANKEAREKQILVHKNTKYLDSLKEKNIVDKNVSPDKAVMNEINRANEEKARKQAELDAQKAEKAAQDEKLILEDQNKRMKNVFDIEKKWALDKHKNTELENLRNIVFDKLANQPKAVLEDIMNANSRGLLCKILASKTGDREAAHKILHDSRKTDIDFEADYDKNNVFEPLTKSLPEADLINNLKSRKIVVEQDMKDFEKNANETKEAKLASILEGNKVVANDNPARTKITIDDNELNDDIEILNINEEKANALNKQAEVEQEKSM